MAAYYSCKIEIVFVNDYPEEYIDIAEFMQPDIYIHYIENGINKGIHSSRVEG